MVALRWRWTSCARCVHRPGRPVTPYASRTAARRRAPDLGPAAGAVAPRSVRRWSWRPAAGRPAASATASAIGTQLDLEDLVLLGQRVRTASRSRARKTWMTSVSTPGELKNSPSVSHRRAVTPASSASSRIAQASGGSRSSSLPAGNLRDPAAGRMAELAQQADASSTVERPRRRHRPGGARSRVRRRGRSAASRVSRLSVEYAALEDVADPAGHARSIPCGPGCRIRAVPGAIAWTTSMLRRAINDRPVVVRAQARHRRVTETTT